MWVHDNSDGVDVYVFVIIVVYQTDFLCILGFLMFLLFDLIVSLLMIKKRKKNVKKKRIGQGSNK